MNEFEELNASNNNAEEHLFTCKDCGGHDLIVILHGTIVREVTETQDCDCGNDESGLAYQRNYHLHIPYVKSFLLDENHRFEEKLEEEYETPEKGEDVESIIYCGDCYDPNYEGDIDEDDQSNDEIEDLECFVECDNCKREIEFGWSHSDRGGRIWPAECTDFNPWICWPEPRYREIWRKKNWLNPNKQY